MIMFRPNENVSEKLTRLRSRSVGQELDRTSLDDVGDRITGRVLEVEYEWRQQ